MRFNRMARQFGVIPNQEREISSATDKEREFMDGKLSFHEMEDVVDEKKSSEGGSFVVGGTQPEKKPDETEVFIGGPEKQEEKPKQEESKDTAEQEKQSDTEGSAEKEDDAVSDAAETEDEIPDEKDQPKEVPAEQTEPEGYREAMELLRMIDKHPGDITMRTRYGSLWSLRGIIGLPFSQAEAMLNEAKDFFSFHVGEIVALAANGKTVGVIVFVDGSSIGVFTGEKILSYRAELLKKTGRVFKDAIAACGLAM